MNSSASNPDRAPTPHPNRASDASIPARLYDHDDSIDAGLAAPPSLITPTHDPTSNQPTSGSNPSASTSTSSHSPQKVAGLTVDGFVQNRLAVIGVLFGVTGFLGLPLLWMNKQFSDGQRWFWAIANTIYTSALIYGAFRICMWSYRQIFP